MGEGCLNTFIYLSSICKSLIIWLSLLFRFINTCDGIQIQHSRDQLSEYCLQYQSMDCIHGYLFYSLLRRSIIYTSLLSETVMKVNISSILFTMNKYYIFFFVSYTVMKGYVCQYKKYYNSSCMQTLAEAFTMKASSGGVVQKCGHIYRYRVIYSGQCIISLLTWNMFGFVVLLLYQRLFYYTSVF